MTGLDHLQRGIDLVDQAAGGTHSVRADLLPEPTPEEDTARLAAWKEDLVALRLEIDAHRLMRGRAAERNGYASAAAWHEHAARLARLEADRHDWCAVILRRQHARVDELAARRGAPPTEEAPE